MKTNQKICTKCQVSKPINDDNFYKEKRSINGFTTECKKCAQKRTKIYRVNNPEKIRNMEKYRSYTKPRHFSKAKIEAKKRNLLWDISFDDFIILLNKPCHYCQDKLSQKQTYTVGGGLDRIDNTKGYLLSNVLPSCKICNILRGNQLTIFETEELIKLLLTIRKL